MSQHRVLRFSAVSRSVIVLTVLACCPCWAQSAAVLGEGSYLTALPPGQGSAGNDLPDGTCHRPDAHEPLVEFAGMAALFRTAIPASAGRAGGPSGLRVFYPATAFTSRRRRSLPACRAAAKIWSCSIPSRPSSPTRGSTPTAIGSSAPVRRRGRSMTVSYGHGSPYVYAVYEGGSPQVTFARDAEIWAPKTGTGSDQDDRCLSPFSVLHRARRHRRRQALRPVRATGSTWSSQDRKTIHQPPVRASRTARWPSCRSDPRRHCSCSNARPRPRRRYSRRLALRFGHEHRRNDLLVHDHGDGRAGNRDAVCAVPAPMAGDDRAAAGLPVPVRSAAS